MKMKHHSGAINGQKAYTPYLFILPFLISYVLFFIYPSLFSFFLSFFKYKGYGSMRFIGLKNYTNLLQYGGMWRSLGNTLFYFFCSFVPIMFLSFIFAILVNSKSADKLRRVYKPLLFMPQMCAIVAASLCFKIIFGTRVGIFSQLIGKEIPFLSDSRYMKWCVVALVSWRGIGWFFIIFLSGLTTISNDIFEAATIDGASPIDVLKKITVPLMKPTFMLAFITNAIGTLKIYIEPNLLLSLEYDPPMEAAPYINLIVNNMAGGQFGMASAAGWILVLIILLLTLLQMKMFQED
jgi:ABC-type sugar transport system permease subunit